MTAECNAVTFQSTKEFWHEAFENFIRNHQNRKGVQRNIKDLTAKLREDDIITIDDLQRLENRETDNERLQLVIDQMSHKDQFCAGFLKALNDCKLTEYKDKLLEEAVKLIENGTFSVTIEDRIKIRAEIDGARSAYSDNQMSAHGSAGPSGKIRSVTFLLYTVVPAIIAIYYISFAFRPPNNEKFNKTLQLLQQLNVEATIPKYAHTIVEKSSKKSLLHFVAEKGNYAVMEELLQQPCEVDIRDNNQLTPLHYAASSGHVEILGLLLRKGADINSANNYCRILKEDQIGILML